MSDELLLAFHWALQWERALAIFAKATVDASSANSDTSTFIIFSIKK